MPAIWEIRYKLAYIVLLSFYLKKKLFFKKKIQLSGKYFSKLAYTCVIRFLSRRNLYKKNIAEILNCYMLCILVDPYHGEFPETIEEYLHHGIMKCIAFNRKGTLLAGNYLSLFLYK